jgi:malate dehydrogenase (oxaloacetate-decarboxylating)
MSSIQSEPPTYLKTDPFMTCTTGMLSCFIDCLDYNEVSYEIGQANNAIVFPGLGLGAIVAKAEIISKGMFTAAADAVADMCCNDQPGESLLPNINKLQEVSEKVALAVIHAAIKAGVARVDITDVEKVVADAMWKPVYKEIRSIKI